MNTETTPTENPVDMILFCPNCGKQHIDSAEPDMCRDCGHVDTDHYNAGERNICGGGRVWVTDEICACDGFTAWLNPPHKSHRCHSCNHVWRPFEYPTNGVLMSGQSLENTGCLECSYIGERRVKLCARCKSEALHKYELCEHFALLTEVENARRCANCQAEIDEVFENFWREIVCDGEGNLDREKVKAELFDFHFIMGQVSEVYDVITRGTLSKPNYYSKTVIAESSGKRKKNLRKL